MNIKCWWFGCEPHPQDPAPPEYITCDRCGENVGYGDLVGDTRHNRFKSWCNYYLFRKWIPEKCKSCEKRYGNHDNCIPF